MCSHFVALGKLLHPSGLHYPCGKLAPLLQNDDVLTIQCVKTHVAPGTVVTGAQHPKHAPFTSFPGQNFPPAHKLQYPASQTALPWHVPPRSLFDSIRRGKISPNLGPHVATGPLFPHLLKCQTILRKVCEISLESGFWHIFKLTKTAGSLIITASLSWDASNRKMPGRKAAPQLSAD